MMTGLLVLASQVDPPEPLLPHEGTAIWPNVFLLVVFLLVVVVLAIVALRAWAFLRTTRRTADEAMKAVEELRRDWAESDV